MSETSDALVVARSPIQPAAPVTVVAGWEVSGRCSDADLTVTDVTPAAKIEVKAACDGRLGKVLGVGFGRAVRDPDGVLLVGSGPGEWLALAAPGTAAEVRARLSAAADEVSDTELVTVADITHGMALMRLTGQRTADLLAKVCGIDFSAAVTPNGAALRSAVAGVVTDLVREDRDGRPGYLLGCERSYGQYLFDALLDAGAEFGIAIDGFDPSRVP